MFWCISWPPESSPSKIIFQCLECLKTCFDESPHHQIQVTKKLFFNVWSGRKRVLMHFQATRIKSVKKLFFNVWSGYQHVLMHFLTTRIKSLKIIFERLEWLKTCFYAFAHTSRPPESSPKKIILFTSGVVKNVFWCISRLPESSP